MQGHIVQNTETFRSLLNELNKAARRLSEGEMVDKKHLENLYAFCKRYEDIQDLVLKQPNSKPSYGVTVWPFVKRNKYI
jgi:hypothetical protein